jgi:hypothetical protein
MVRRAVAVARIAATMLILFAVAITGDGGQRW